MFVLADKNLWFWLGHRNQRNHRGAKKKGIFHGLNLQRNSFLPKNMQRVKTADYNPKILE